jgi:hypothetical protein
MNRSLPPPRDGEPFTDYLYRVTKTLPLPHEALLPSAIADRYLAQNGPKPSAAFIARDAIARARRR